MTCNNYLFLVRVKLYNIQGLGKSRPVRNLQKLSRKVANQFDV